MSEPIHESNFPHHERIADPLFRQAVDLLDAGNADVLADFLRLHPQIVHRRITFEGEGYFSNPSLLEFVAENPIRNGKLPANIVTIAEIVVNAGAGRETAMLNGTLGLVSSGCIARQCGVQLPLIDLLCDSGADPNFAMPAALAHGEFDAVAKLLQRGAKPDLRTAAATGQTERCAALLPTSHQEDRHWALALAAQFGHLEILRLLVGAGEDINRYNPAGAHAHSTPLHQAALAGHLEIVQFLVAQGAKLDWKDTVFQGTPGEWATHAGKQETADWLKNRSKGTPPAALHATPDPE